MTNKMTPERPQELMITQAYLELAAKNKRLKAELATAREKLGIVTETLEAERSELALLYKNIEKDPAYAWLLSFIRQRGTACEKAIESAIKEPTNDQQNDTGA